VERKLENIKVARSLVERSLGLIGKKDFGVFMGLKIESCNSIHTFFVRFPIDVVFLDEKNEILKVNENLKPFRFSSFVWKAKSVLEMPAGFAKKQNLEVGDKIEFI
jgi:hypothetical protein